MCLAPFNLHPDRNDHPQPHLTGGAKQTLIGGENKDA